MKKLLQSSLLILTTFLFSTMSWGQTLINETLRTGSLPAGWNQSNISFQTTAGGYARFDATSSVLTTPTFNASANASIDIEFDVAKWGSGGDGPVTVEYSLDGGATWTTQGNSTTPTSGTYQSNTISINTTSATMQVRFTRSSSPSRKRFRDVVITGIGSAPPPSTPIITLSESSISGLDYEPGDGPSANQTFTASGTNLTANIVITAPTNFHISTNASSGFGSSLTLTQSSGTVSSTTIYVRLASGLAVNTYSGTLSATSTGATQQDVSLSGEVRTLGWQITVEDTDFVIDFDNSVAGVNNGQFDGSGFSPSPTTGQLNSQAWETTGLSDGNSNFGDTKTSGDFARGSSTGGETTGGFYAFETSSNDFSLGFQGAGSDFTPGTITLRAQNQTGDTVNNANLSYILYVFNDQGRANSFNFSYSTDGSNYTTIPSLDFTSAEVADGSPVWVSNAKGEFISGLSIADGEHLYLRWESDDVSGGGSRDELAIDDITLNFNPTISPLPVELISFDATVVDEQKSVVLEWETESENNNDYFTIERSVDGYNWESITSVNGMGNSSATTHYDYKDRQPMKGVSYYRLKQTDFNGVSEFFDIRSVMINADDKALLNRVNMLGQKVDTSYKGIVFLHFSDGSTVQILQNN